MPTTIVSDNGTEFTSMAILSNGFRIPALTGTISRPEGPGRTVSLKASTASCAPLVHVNMHCRAVDECLNETLFGALGDARKTLEEWQEDYNWQRPHSGSGNLTPMEFSHRKAMDKMAA
ncbi:hypothetical protein ROLI_010880 [Roseobacter fucihabitans]|uniref:Integrase catalytic domain-containing protein n=1 Tax=Roseobacter fucihabitans TaxID=1537242 RepID=A0ABZ2BS11_9RHOB